MKGETGFRHMLNESLAGDASEGLRLAVYCAYGHVEWPNGRPDDPSRECR